MATDHLSFCVIESKQNLHIVPSRRHMVHTVALLFCGGATAIVGGICMDVWFKHEPLAWWRDMYFFTIAGCLTAFLLWTCGIWGWLIRNRQLCVDLSTQEVTFGNSQLCGPGAVSSVELHYDSDPDATEPYSIHFRLTDGMIANVPSPLFAGIRNFEEASDLAELLAAKLNVHVCRNA